MILSDAMYRAGRHSHERGNFFDCILLRDQVATDSQRVEKRHGENGQVSTGLLKGPHGSSKGQMATWPFKGPYGHVALQRAW